MSNNQDAGACPVDHQARQAWLDQARAAQQASAASSASCPVDHPKTPAACPVDHTQQQKPKSGVCPVDHTQQQQKPTRTWTQTFTSYMPSWPSSSTPATPAPAARQEPDDGLGTERIVSSIPRSAATHPDSYSVEHGASANAEMDTGADAGSGNWVYPSEKMFFEAMRRKGYDANSADMKTVVPIHNAVNERAWAQICKWEAPYISGTT